MTRQPIAQACEALIRRDPAQPLITQIWADGQRVELSTRTFENNVAKAANLLQEEFDAGADTAFLIGLPLHWQLSVWLTAIALVGSSARPLLSGEGAYAGDLHTDQYAAAFVDRDTDVSIDPTFAVSLHPFGLPEGDTPAGQIDLARDIRGYSDVYIPVTAEPDSVWLHVGDDHLTQGQALDRARSLAASVGLSAGGRLLIHSRVSAQALLALSAIPFAVPASIVLCSDPGADINAIATAERCTAVLQTDR